MAGRVVAVTMVVVQDDLKIDVFHLGFRIALYCVHTKCCVLYSHFENGLSFFFLARLQDNKNTFVEFLFLFFFTLFLFLLLLPHSKCL